MHQNELQMGDLVFFVSPGIDIVEHTSIYLGMKAGVHYVLHATKGSYKAMMVTQLKNTMDSEFKYRIMRPKDVKLSIDAIVILLRWVEHQVPYASKAKIDRLMRVAEQSFSFELKSSAPLQAFFGRKSYRKNYAQYFSMANALPYVVEDGGVVEGFGCAESIVLAFNLALLMRYAKHELLADGRIAWGIHEGDMEDFVDFIHNPLPFDARASLSAGLCDHCATNPEDWLDLGELTPELSVCLDEDAREIWKIFREDLKKRSSYLIERHRSLSASPELYIPYSKLHTSNSLLEVISYATAKSEDDEISLSLKLEHEEKSLRTISRSNSQRQGSPIAFFFGSTSQDLSDLFRSNQIFSVELDVDKLSQSGECMVGQESSSLSVQHAPMQIKSIESDLEGLTTCRLAFFTHTNGEQEKVAHVMTEKRELS